MTLKRVAPKAAPTLVDDQTLSAPDTRTRSIWLTQLVLAASVVIIGVLVVALRPSLFGVWNFVVGILAIIVVTVATLAVPWARLPREAVLVVVFLDTLAIGLMASNTELRFGYLWVFPVMWVAMYFPATMLGAVLATIGVILLLDSTSNPDSNAALRIFIVLLSLGFIGITAHLAMRQMRALRRVLQRQARRLSETLDRRSGQERRTNEILNGVDAGVARVSLSGSLLMINDAFARLYGLDPRDVSQPAKSVEYTGLRGMPVPLSERPLARAARGEIFTDARVWVFTATGEWRVLSVSSKRLSGLDREDASMLLLAYDVTAITHAQRERERLSAIASHELKHPLTVMIGNADLALEDPDLSPRIRERLETILRASERVLEMTSSMLKSSRTAFEGRESYDDIDVRQIVVDSVDSFRPTATAHDVTIALDVHEPLPATADGFRMRQVVDNLVSNAIKYTPRDGDVRITGSMDDDIVTLTVSDTGIGISPDDLPSIMTPYFRTDTAKDTASGTGLGLGITREIIAAHGGTLAIDSELGSGTTVTVQLPRFAPASRGAEKEDS